MKSAINRSPIAIVSNDWHLKSGNEDQVLESIDHMINFAKKHDIKILIGAGDFFHSRSQQRLKTLLTFKRILDKLWGSDMEYWFIPGNHDKPVYEAEESFVEVFDGHPAMRYFKKPTYGHLKGIDILMMPFFEDKIQAQMLEEAAPADLLIGHFELNGSIYLGKVSEGRTIDRKMLKKFKKVYLGHFHNTHEVTEDIIHLPSLRQNGFGEDANKGFTVLYDDLSYEIVRGKFREFEKVTIDLDEISNKDLKKEVEKYRDSDNAVRFELTGSEDKLKAVSKKMFTEAGIDVKVKYDKVFEQASSSTVEGYQVAPIVIKEHTEATIREDFKAYCKEKDLNYEQGLQYLNDFLKKK